MKIKIKNKIKITSLVLFVLIGLFLILIPKMQAADVDCDINGLPDSSDGIYFIHRLQCNKTNDGTCAYSKNIALPLSVGGRPTSSFSVVGAYCKQPTGDMCIVGRDAGCNQCNGFVADGQDIILNAKGKSGTGFLVTDPVYSHPSSANALFSSNLQLYFGKDIGCKSPKVCVNTGNRVPIPGLSQEDIYQCSNPPPGVCDPDNDPNCVKCAGVAGGLAGRVFASDNVRGCGAGYLCAYADYSAADIGRKVVCRKPNAALNQCLLSSGSVCKQCDGDVEAGEEITVQTEQSELYFPKSQVGCKENFSCLKAPTAAGRSLYLCATPALACPPGHAPGAEGYYLDSAGKLQIRYCHGKDDKACAPVQEGDFMLYYLKSEVEVKRAYQDENGQTGYVAYYPKEGRKVYCANVPEAKTCYLEYDTETIEKLYASNDGPPNSQQKIISSLVPAYDCKGEGVSAWLRRAGWGLFNSTIGTVVALVIGIVLTFVTLVLGFLLWTITAFLEWAIGISQMDMGVVDIIWGFLRDFSNMFFIMILLYIAFCTVLRIQSNNLKKMLPGFFAAAILINFSKVFCQVTIDLAQILINSLYHIKPLGTWGIITHVLQAGGITEGFFVGDVFGKTEMKDLLGVIASQGLMVIYMLAAIMTFAVAAILLVIRIVTLWIMTAISPLIYVAMAAGQGNIVKKYWTRFLRTALFAPALIFCIILSLQVLSYDLDKYVKSEVGSPKEILTEEVTGQKIFVEAGSFSRFVQMVFALTFIWAGIFAARESGVIGSKAIVGGAQKMFNKAAPWLTGAKPAGYGLRALGRYGWGRALEGKHGKFFAHFSPKAWKMGHEARKKRRERETYAPKAQYLQAKMATWSGFWRGKGPGFEREKLYAYAQRAASVKEQEHLLSEADVPTEMLYTRLDELLKEMEDKGFLGSEKALTPQVEALLRVILSRGDINDLLKGSQYANKIGDDLISGGRAVMGADARLMERWFGNKEEAATFTNVIAEASKDRYLQFAYSAMFDDRTNTSMKTGETEENLKEIVLDETAGEKASEQMRFTFDTAVFQKYLKMKAESLQKNAGGLKMEVGALYDLMTANLGHTKEEILADKKGLVRQRIEKLQQEGSIASNFDVDMVKEGIATVVDTYNMNRNAAIRSEILKKSPQRKWRMHIGSLLGDFADTPDGYEDAPPTVKYFGITPSSEAFVEATTWEDAEKIGTWADPRIIDALLYEKNQDEIKEIAKRIDDRNEQKTGKRTDFERIYLTLFENLRRAERRGSRRETTEDEEAEAMRQQEEHDRE